jgi:hypothetical protein
VTTASMRPFPGAFVPVPLSSFSGYAPDGRYAFVLIGATNATVWNGKSFSVLPGSGEVAVVDINANGVICGTLDKRAVVWVYNPMNGGYSCVSIPLSGDFTESEAMRFNAKGRISGVIRKYVEHAEVTEHPNFLSKLYLWEVDYWEYFELTGEFFPVGKWTDYGVVPRMSTWGEVGFDWTAMFGFSPSDVYYYGLNPNYVQGDYTKPYRGFYNPVSDHWHLSYVPSGDSVVFVPLPGVTLLDDNVFSFYDFYYFGAPFVAEYGHFVLHRDVPDGTTYTDVWNWIETVTRYFDFNLGGALVVSDSPPAAPSGDRAVAQNDVGDLLWLTESWLLW